MKPAPKSSDSTKSAAVRLWTHFPAMKPVGEARIKRHLAELEALLAVVPEDDLTRIILLLKADQWRKSWASSFETVAEKLPAIRSWIDGKEPARASYAEQWQKENRE